MLVLTDLICVIVIDAVVGFLLDRFLSFGLMFRVIFCLFLVLFFLYPAPLELWRELWMFLQVSVLSGSILLLLVGLVGCVPPLVLVFPNFLLVSEICCREVCLTVSII